MQFCNPVSSTKQSDNWLPGMATLGDTSPPSSIMTTSPTAISSPIQAKSSPTSAKVNHHARAASQFSDLTSARPNRFSIQFPIQPTTSFRQARAATSPTYDSVSSAADLPSVVSSDTTDGNFLTAIAAQERRVLEIREELQRAEANLTTLKKQWAQHEAKRKRDEAKRITKLQPLQTARTDSHVEDDVDGSNAWMQQEMERRKALLASSKTSNRTVFSGSRHTRALSLLSPIRDTAGAPSPTLPVLPPRQDSLQNPVAHPKSSLDEGPRSVAVHAIHSSQDQGRIVGFDVAGDPIRQLADAGIDHEMLLRQGRKMALDLKDGLWTFWEDLRQATVGEESTQDLLPPHAPQQHPQNIPRRKSSTHTLKSARKSSSKASLRQSSRESLKQQQQPTSRKPSPSGLPDLANPSFWTEQGITPPAPTKPAPTKKSPGKALSSAKLPSTVSHTSAPSTSMTSSVPMATQNQQSKPSTRSSKASSTLKHPSPPSSDPPPLEDPWETWPNSSSPVRETPRTSSTCSSGTSSSSFETHTLPSTASPGGGRASTSSRRGSEYLDPTTAAAGGYNITSPADPSNHSSPHHRTSSSNKDPIPWPSLSAVALSTGSAALRRTASHLMREWERSLTPSPNEEMSISANARVVDDPGLTLGGALSEEKAAGYFLKRD